MAPSIMETDEPLQPSGDLILEQALDENLVGGTKSDASFKNLPRHLLSRLVSQEELNADCVKDSAPKFPPMSRGRSPLLTERSSSSTVPPLPNPLNDTGILQNHICALRLEADLYPLRLALSRLMAHPTHNRKGMFNHPVDPVAMGLSDYQLIVPNPMDLGSIKRRLHALAYLSRQQVVDDIRLVFSNAMRYNPPHNAVHKCAKELLAYFESYLEGLGPCVLGSACNAAELLGKQVHDQSSLDAERRPRVASTPLGSCDIPEVYSTPMLVASVPSNCQLIDEIGQNNASTGRTPMAEMTSPNSKLQQSSTKPKVRMPRKNASASNTLNRVSHACDQCQGRTCLICEQGCLQHEPALLVCCGAHCGGARIRKGALYFITKDGTLQFCERCYVGLPSTLLHSVQNDACRYKQELLKRKNNEEIAEGWISCKACLGGVHAVCAMHNDFVHDKSKYVCADCASPSIDHPPNNDSDMSFINVKNERMYTFVSGLAEPVPITAIKTTSSPILDSESLKECPISRFIQDKVQKVMRHTPNAAKTINVRVISDCYRQFSVPDVIRRYFRMATNSDDVLLPPSFVNYRQKAIAMFQKIDGLDVCIFCMYVQEYDGEQASDGAPNKRVYIAYIDSVEHFRPRESRTEVFHEILMAYLATARERGYQTAHIWACPPSRGNCFVFWNHPSSQRTPTKERLLAWYHTVLSKAVDFGIVTDVKSLFESDFEQPLSEISFPETISELAGARAQRMVCPPLVDGDFWIEEAVRIYSAHLARHSKVRTPTDVCVWNVSSLVGSKLNPCPALQVAALLKDRIMTHPATVPFRRPVNAAALKLKDYHKIVRNPMDLGTIYSRCILGDYYCLEDVVNDVELMVSNAKMFNPPDHVVYRQADEVLSLFLVELTSLLELWQNGTTGKPSFKSHAEVSMSLDAVVNLTNRSCAPNSPIVIEDDRSSDGSRSLESSVATPCWPVATQIQVSNEMPSCPMESASDVNIMTRSKKPKSHRGRSKVKKEPLKKLDILSDGPEAIVQRMVGDDLWLLEKRNQSPPKDLKPSKGKKRARNSITVTEDEPLKKRRQSWLCQEVGASIRSMRTSFFSCSLTPPKNMSEVEVDKLEAYRTYVRSFLSEENDGDVAKPSLADARSALLELSQFRHFEFDTLRRAKYSTTMLLYHIHNAQAPGVTPVCTTCGEAIAEVRWHKAKKICEIRNPSLPYASRFSNEGLNEKQAPRSSGEDLCAACHEKRGMNDDFIPIPVHAHDSYTKDKS